MKNVILLVIMLSMAVLSQLYCINHMDLMFYINGIQPYGMFGQGLTALDFNGDGNDDLAVLQNRWVPDSLQYQLPDIGYGRILIYYGGPGFDNLPDFTVEGTYNRHLWQIGDSGYLVNLGDVNGDGFDDLGTMGYTEGNFDTMRPHVAVYYGGQNPSTQPGYYKSFTSAHPGGYAEIEALGDINGDNFDDFCYMYRPDTAYEELSITGFVMGGSMQEITWRIYDDDDLCSITTAGDVNNDGFDDYISYYGNVTSLTQSITVYYSNTNTTISDSTVIYTANANVIIAIRCRYLGDINGDGYEDFAGVMGYPDTQVWYGSDNLTSQCNLLLFPSWTGTGGTDRGLVHGDLNSDGFEDVIGSEPMEFGERGGFRVWLGGANMNGTSDLTVQGHLSGMLMGTGMAAGDFNGDGYCDVAAGEPHSSTFDSLPGRVYVYAGNAELADTTVGNEDENITPEVSNWDFRIIPNPRIGRKSWKLTFTGKGYEKLNVVSVRIYNLKGQKLKNYEIKETQLISGEVLLPDWNLPAGIYEVSLYNNDIILKVKKVTIK